MTELRRSSRVRQLTKNSPQYYEPDEKKSILSTPHVRPRKWRSSEVSVGYFMVRRWVPRDQEHLTADLHGGLTEKAEVVTPAKPTMRAVSKGSARSKARTRPGSASSPAGAAARGRASPAYNKGGEGRAPGFAPPPPRTPPRPPAVPPTAGLPGGGVPLSGGATVGGARAREASPIGGVRVGGAGKRPASAMGQGSGGAGPSPLPSPAKSRRVSGAGVVPASPAARGPAGPATANWRRKTQGQQSPAPPSVWTAQLGNDSLKAGKGRKAVVPGGEGAVGAGRGVGAMWGASVGNGDTSRQWKV